MSRPFILLNGLGIIGCRPATELQNMLFIKRNELPSEIDHDKIIMFLRQEIHCDWETAFQAVEEHDGQRETSLYAIY